MSCHAQTHIDTTARLWYCSGRVFKNTSESCHVAQSANKETVVLFVKAKGRKQKMEDNNDKKHLTPCRHWRRSVSSTLVEQQQQLWCSLCVYAGALQAQYCVVPSPTFLKHSQTNTLSLLLCKYKGNKSTWSVKVRFRLSVRAYCASKLHFGC